MNYTYICNLYISIGKKKKKIKTKYDQEKKKNYCKIPMFTFLVRVSFYILYIFVIILS